MKQLLILTFSILILFPAFAQKNPADANRLMIVKGGKVGYIDTLGNTVIPPSFSGGSQFSEGVASVVHPGNNGPRYAFINDEMDVMIKTFFDVAGDFSEGLARVQVDNKWGYINKGGITLIEPQFELCFEFNEGYAQAKKNRKWGIINRKGEWEIQPEYYEVSDVSEGLVATQKEMGGKWVYIDLKGKKAITDTFSRAGAFANGLAPVRKGDKWGFIDKTGKLVIDYKYTNATEFSSGLAAVEKDDANWGFINTKGEEVIKFEFDRGTYFRFNHAMVEKGEEYGYINKKGEFIWKTTKD